MKKLILEARINEYAMRDHNRNVPWTSDEIAETAARVREEGASILHFHARTVDGQPLNTFEAYDEIIRKVRAKSDILILPTLGFISNDADARKRIDNVVRLAADPATKPDIAPIDTGSANLESYDRGSGEVSFVDRVYANTTDSLIHYARELKRAGVKPKMVSWSVGFTRRALMLMDIGLIDEPGYMLFHMTDGKTITGHPGTVQGLDAHLTFLPEDRRIDWTANVLGGNLLALADAIARRGGHLAIGIGDYPYPELDYPPNEVLIRETVRVIRAAGREPATPDEVRAMLELSS
ncbi:BKACE family enzyme [Sinorhizobium prairiense]|uniref:3-keto-5-aminohexanoate cleavage protein n=1 Tax=unclassified Sinorhizobium TaxID=2613772 RepID=UPI0023D886B5|nr:MULTISPECIES: 3-keto-5-aminohexanoate cleavage protein [unclassified Sinorhizobium]WEJ08736.1 3-keto-5-aminohexanoate cleavage protein [Sinorhizobium sp. M103]WEJ13763.1 3-keto-5-aminohexanoate cleavage protein [Sinorhizobium sp. K101]WEJ35360.1 3-keto-5-aminohexanoate cleavage protein [Sinorhizobium sp. C101]